MQYDSIYIPERMDNPELYTSEGWERVGSVTMVSPAAGMPSLRRQIHYRRPAGLGDPPTGFVAIRQGVRA
jgi:hypothetical protein